MFKFLDRSSPTTDHRSLITISKTLSLLLGQRADSLGQEGDVERLLERFAEAVFAQLLRGGLVFAGQGDDQRGFVRGVAAEVGGDLEGFAAAHRQVDDDRVGMEASA